MKWYGYIHTDGSLHAKRYLGDYLDVVEARTSPFVQVCFEPFEAADRTEAELILRQKSENF